MLFFFLLLLPSFIHSSIVQTPFGEVEGFEHLTEKGIATEEFLGIRYGKSTSGSRRFQKPEMVEAWAPERISAKEFGPSCDSFTPAREPGTIFSEDCLFLNVITPKHRERDILNANLPVFFYIHGGFYEVGSSTYSGYERLAEKFATEGIVVVTINYRLGPFGFLSLGDSSAPGNMGLWDQTLALEFVQQIIPSFGGDPSRITVGGHSAGSASASALQFSPYSSYYFSQAILISGSSLAEFAQSEMVVEESKKLLISLDCPVAPTEEALDCLRRFAPDEIIEAVEKIGSSRRHPNVVKFNPRIDGDFFPLPIQQLALAAHMKRTLLGSTDQESALFEAPGVHYLASKRESCGMQYTLRISQEITVMNEEMGWIAAIALTKEEQKTFSRRDLVDFIEKVVVTDEEHKEFAGAFRKLLVDFYAGEDDSGKDSAFYVQRYSDLNSDLQFLIPMYQEIQLKIALGWPSYLYILQHETKSFPREGSAVQGTYHGDELEHFLNHRVMHPLKENKKEDFKFGTNFVSSMVNFIKTGDPSSPSLSWRQVTKTWPFQHASITTNITLKKEGYRANAAQLWLESVPQAVSGELLRTSRLPGATNGKLHIEL
ncbi:hypothetical protein PMAYCL1PPCAC_01346 [Pristionchus mayeri]|uniref:Carboxylic ester hydrolase n=1 Tax=Pristionchus mayeri TaxID=1317129 RepID=A0AAN4Z237_9BILA|nr:hypothetical protein PMAYCL1PPCAC_01346 [Pristionchus mayeri]